MQSDLAGVESLMLGLNPGDTGSHSRLLSKGVA
jgi:hypothetical protein